MTKASLQQDKILSYIRFGLYTAETRAVLLAVLHEAMVNQHYAPLIRAGLIQKEKIQGAISPLLHYAVTCAEDYPELKKLEKAGKLSATTYLSNRVHDTMFAVCDGWEKVERSREAGSVYDLNTPALIFSGDLDPITPPEYAYETEKHLKHSKVLLFHGRGHSVSHYGCGPKLMRKFVEDASVEKLDSDCLNRLNELPIYLNLNGFPP